MTYLVKSFALIASALFLANAGITVAEPRTKNIVCYYSFDMERIIPFNEPSIHTAECYAITDGEFESVKKFLKESPTAEDSIEYQSTNIKAMIYNDSIKMYVDGNGIVKIDESTFKKGGAKSMRSLIQSIIKNKPVLPRSRN